jgi:cobalt-zinc-cadmium efflux system membrane fusion protein
MITRNILLVLGLTTLGACLACGRHAAPESQAAPAGEVWLSPTQDREARLVVEPVGLRDLGGLVNTVGRLSFDDRRVSHIFSPLNGRVTRLMVDPGQRVKAGQTLALIDSPDMGSALSDARKAEAVLVAADREYARQKELFEAHAGARRDLEAAEANFKVAGAERDRAQQRAASLYAPNALGVSQGFQLKSPISGEVINRTANPGVEVQGQYGGGTAVELFTIGELDQLWLLADLYEVDIFRVAVGSPLEITVAGYPGNPIRAKVEWVSGALDPATRTAKVRCSIPNPRRLLKPEMFAQVAIKVDKTRALAIPRSAVARIGNQTFAYVDLGPRPDGSRRFQCRPLQVDEQVSGDLLPVKAGLKAGETVVTQGAMILSGQN